MFGGLAKLLGREVAQLGNVLTGKAKTAQMKQPGAPVTNTPIPSPMGQHYLANPQSSEFTGPNAVDPKVFGYGPDNTAQPQPTPLWMQQLNQGPVADSAPIPSAIGNQYASNPWAPQFRNVDPMIFGYGEDKSQYR